MNLKRLINQRSVMIYLVIPMLFFVVLSGCQVTPATPVETPVESPITETNTAIEAPVTSIEEPAENPQGGPVQIQYEGIINHYMKALPTVDVQAPAKGDVQSKFVDDMVQLFERGASSVDIRKLYVEGITQLEAKNADRFTAYAISGLRRNSFEDYQEIEKYSNDQAFVQTFFQVAEKLDYNYIALNRSVDQIEDPVIKSLIKGAVEQGYFIASSEGMLYYLVDFTEFAKYRLYNSSEMASLLEMQAIDDLDPRTSDAALIIDGDTLAARAYAIEQRLLDFKGTRYEKYLAVMLKDYMFALFFGTDNTPVFDYENNRIRENAVDLYKSIQTIEGSYLAELVKAYVAILSANDNILDDATREKAMAVISGIYTQYDVSAEIEYDFGQWMSGVTVAE